MELETERPSSGVTLSQWCSSAECISTCNAGEMSEEERVQFDLCLAVSGRMELAPLLRRWNQAKLEEAVLQVMALDLITISEANINSLYCRMLEQQKVVTTSNWNRILCALDRHLVPRLLHWIDEEHPFSNELLSRFLSLFPRVTPYLESVNRHGRAGLLSCCRSSVLRHLAGIPQNVKLTSQKKMELVDLILGDWNSYSLYLQDMNLERLQHFRDSIPWETTVEVDKSVLLYPPGDFVLYCTAKSSIRASLRSSAKIKVSNANEELLRLQQHASEVELPDPRPFTALLNWLLSQLDNVSLT